MTLRYAHVPKAEMVYGSWSSYSDDDETDEESYNSDIDSKLQNQISKTIPDDSKLDLNISDVSQPNTPTKSKSKNKKNSDSDFGFGSYSDSDTPQYKYVQGDVDEFTKIQTVSFTEEALLLDDDYDSDHADNVCLEESLNTTLVNSQENIECSDSSSSEQEQDQSTLLNEEPIIDDGYEDDDTDDESFQAVEENLFDTSKIEQTEESTFAHTHETFQLNQISSIENIQNQINKINEIKQEQVTDKSTIPIQQQKSIVKQPENEIQNIDLNSLESKQNQIQNKPITPLQEQKPDKKQLEKENQNISLNCIKSKQDKPIIPAQKQKPDENQQEKENLNLNVKEPSKSLAVIDTKEDDLNLTITLKSDQSYPQIAKNNKESELLPKIRQLLNDAMEIRHKNDPKNNSDDDDFDLSRRRFIDVDEEPELNSTPIIENKSQNTLFSHLCELKKNNNERKQSSVAIISIEHLHNIFSLPKSELLLRISFVPQNESVKTGNDYDILLRNSTKTPGKLKPSSIDKIVAIYPHNSSFTLNFSFLNNRSIFASTRLNLSNSKPGKIFLQFMKEPGGINCDISSKLKGFFAKIKDPCLEITLSFANEKDCRRLTKIPDFCIMPLCAVDSVMAFRDCFYILQTTKKNPHYAQLISGFGSILDDPVRLEKMSNDIKEAKKMGLTTTKFVEILSKFVSESADMTPFSTDELLPLKIYYNILKNEKI